MMMSHRKPVSVTFTGLDDQTDLIRAYDLYESYPEIEYGVLSSPSRRGIHPRYPSMSRLDECCDSDLPLSLHLCGGDARVVAAGGDVLTYLWLPAFTRVQVNGISGTPSERAGILRFADLYGVQPILQLIDPLFPEDDDIQWLSDCSGGRGIVAETWPRHPGGIHGVQLVGYAGGISPMNVTEVIAAIDASGQYWIDMESGVRTDDHFDLDKCEAVCRAVYGIR